MTLGVNEPSAYARPGPQDHISLHALLPSCAVPTDDVVQTYRVEAGKSISFGICSRNHKAFGAVKTMDLACVRRCEGAILRRPRLIMPFRPSHLAPAMFSSMLDDQQLWISIVL